MIGRQVLLLLLSSCLVAQHAAALYSSGSSVVDLNPNNFDHRVKDSPGIWIVEFYAPWCGHCQQLAPEYEKAAKVLKGVVNVGGINCDEHKQLCSQYGIQGFPTIKVFGEKKSSPEDYQGPRTAERIVHAARGAAESLIIGRMGGRPSGGGGGAKSSGGGSKGDVVELTESNFKKLVLDSEDAWLVEFFAPWCGHCKNLEPHWKKAAGELSGKVKLGAVDATVYQSLAGQYGVQGYPTIKYFPAGAKLKAEDYNGGRTAADIVAWALERHTENLPPPELVQITEGAVLEEHCEKKPLCIVSFLPHILDCQSQCRNDYLNMLRRLGDNFKKHGWGWLWSEGAAQRDLEEALEIGGYGYPAMSALNVKKMKHSELTGSFGYDGIREYLRDLSYGKGRTGPIKGAKVPEVVAVDPWDGKDGELPEEEDIDLSDVELDDFGKEEL